MLKIGWVALDQQALPAQALLEGQRVAEIKSLLRKQGLPLKGKKAELIERLCNASSSSNSSSPIKKKANIVEKKKKKEEVVVVDDEDTDTDDIFEEKEPTPKPRRVRSKPKVNYADYFDEEENEDLKQDEEEEPAWSEDEFVPEDDDDESDWEE